MRLRWHGWESDTLTLQRAGWQISANEDPSSMCIVLAIRHPDTNIGGLSRIEAMKHCTRRPDEYGLASDLYMKVVGHDMRIRGQYGQSGAWRAVDAEPQVITEPVRSLQDLCHFAPAVSQRASIMVAEEDVSYLLARILEKQQPAKEAYFRNQAMEERESGLLVPKVHAQIITLGDRRAA